MGDDVLWKNVVVFAILLPDAASIVLFISGTVGRYHRQPGHAPWAEHQS